LLKIFSSIFGRDRILAGINLGIKERAVNAFGPAGGGKSTLLRCINRLNDLTEVRSSSGRILLDGKDLLDPDTDVIALRRKVGMVFARPVCLPLSIRQNLTYGLELAGERRRSRLDSAVERSLILAALWEEVRNDWMTSCILVWRSAALMPLDRSRPTRNYPQMNRPLARPDLDQ
jgi:phosphate transport system ATP-binding protein